MCDFSEYGGASEELANLLTTLPPAAELSVEELKAATNQGREDASRSQMTSLSSQVEIKDHLIPARDSFQLEARSYRPASVPTEEKLPIYIHFHGGGFLFGTLASEDATCSRIAIDSKVVVININYRHTPENKFPTPWNDSEDGFEWVYTNANNFSGDPRQIVIGGISAGAQLAACLAQTKKRENSPSYQSLKGQVLMVPCLSHPDCYEPILKQMVSPDISSYKENEFAPILPLTRMKYFTNLLYPNGTPDFSDRRANPGHASHEEVKGLPPTTLGIAGLDPLRDEGLLYGKLLAENGVSTDVHLFKGVPHGYRRFGDKLSASKQWDRVMHDGIRWALEGPTASGKFEIIVHS